MVLDAEAVIDRRRLKRRVTAWRIAAVMLALLFLGALALSNDQMSGPGALLPHVARLSVSGIITDDRKMTGFDRQARQVRSGEGGHPRHQQPWRHHHGRRGDVRRDPPPRREEARRRRLRHARHLRRLYRRRSPPIASSFTATPSPDRSASSSNGSR